MNRTGHSNILSFRNESSPSFKVGYASSDSEEEEVKNEEGIGPESRRKQRQRKHNRTRSTQKKKKNRVTKTPSSATNQTSTSLLVDGNSLASCICGRAVCNSVITWKVGPITDMTSSDNDAIKHSPIRDPSKDVQLSGEPMSITSLRCGYEASAPWSVNDLHSVRVGLFGSPNVPTETTSAPTEIILPSKLKDITNQMIYLIGKYPNSPVKISNDNESSTIALPPSSISADIGGSSVHASNPGQIEIESNKGNSIYFTNLYLSPPCTKRQFTIRQFSQSNGLFG